MGGFTDCLAVVLDDFAIRISLGADSVLVAGYRGYVFTMVGTGFAVNGFSAEDFIGNKGEMSTGGGEGAAAHTEGQNYGQDK
jgi:hypothetical protein